MRYATPIILWTLVLAAGLFFYILSPQKPKGTSGATTVKNAAPQGTVIDSIPWKHLPHVDRFKLTDQDGNKFDSAELTGKPYVVSFFFASCPTFCKDLNKELERVNQLLKHTDVQFLTVTVDPENDTPEALNRYAAEFDAKPERWAFLTGQMYQLKELGEHNFNVVVDKDTHTDNILLVDKWGKYRDRFKWDEPMDMQRFIRIVKEVADEKAPPLNDKVDTRNVLAGYEHKDLANVPWIRDFHLTERNGDKFFSRDLTGEVWIANFFFSSCPGICIKQNEYLRDLQNRLGKRAPRVVSITTDPVNDTPERLTQVAKKLDADDKNWLFLTGQSHLIERIGSEFFKAHANDDHHSTQLFVVDRWGEVRGNFDWQQPSQEVEMLKLVEQLREEDRPQRPVDPVRKKFAEDDEEDGESKK